MREDDRVLRSAVDWCGVARNIIWVPVPANGVLDCQLSVFWRLVIKGSFTSPVGF
jgi:hypothetical protein